MSPYKTVNRFAWEEQLLSPFLVQAGPLIPHAQQHPPPSAEGNPAHSLADVV